MSSNYVAPFVDAAGLHLNTFQACLNYYTGLEQRVFGSDINLDNSSMDMQFCAGMAQALFDTEQMAQLSYNNFSPATAIGTGLALNGALNGLAPKTASYSTCPVILTGFPSQYTIINNGVAADTNGNQWNLPSSVTIPGSGTVTVTATCQTLGAITAAIGQITTIVTPTYGWTGITNPSAAAPGQPVEDDFEFRARQAESVESPSQTEQEALKGAVADLPGVISVQIYENNTASALTTVNNGYNPGGFPPRSVTLVVNGGNGQDIAGAIALRKTLGCSTNGDQVYNVTDSHGDIMPIRFYLPSPQTILVSVTIQPLNGYTSAIGTALKQAIADYINSLSAGEGVYISEVQVAACTVNTDHRKPYFSLQGLEISVNPNPVGFFDLTMNFNQQPVTAADLSNITLTVN